MIVEIIAPLSPRASLPYSRGCTQGIDSERKFPAHPARDHIFLPSTHKFCSIATVRRVSTDVLHTPYFFDSYNRYSRDTFRRNFAQPEGWSGQRDATIRHGRRTDYILITGGFIARR
jgi:hypothetical protein